MVIRGVLESMVVLLVGLCPWIGILCLLTLFPVWIESTDQSGQWPQHEHPVCVKGESDFPSHPIKLGPQKKYGRICGSSGVP